MRANQSERNQSRLPTPTTVLADRGDHAAGPGARTDDDVRGRDENDFRRRPN